MPNYINQLTYPVEFALHQKYAQSALLLELVWTHSNIITDIATQLYQRSQFDTSSFQLPLLTQAALLHDIGVYLCGGFEWLPGQPPSDKLYIQHTIIGAWILQQEGCDPRVIQAAHSHTGVGLTVEDITKFGLQLPPDDYSPVTPLEKLISYASKFHSKAPKFKTSQEIKDSLARFGNEKVSIFNQWQAEIGEPDLAPIQEKYAAWHTGFQYQIQHLSPNTHTQLNSAGIALTQV